MVRLLSKRTAHTAVITRDASERVDGGEASEGDRCAEKLRELRKGRLKRQQEVYGPSVARLPVRGQ